MAPPNIMVWTGVLLPLISSPKKITHRREVKIKAQGLVKVERELILMDGIGTPSNKK